MHTDRTLLEGIVGNLFANAVTYTAGQGRIRCTLKSNGGGFVFSLSNTNGALTKQDLDRMFEPFWRKDAARSDSGQCGLGLSLVQAYAGLLNIGLEADLPHPNLLQLTLCIPI